jgi:DNA-binding CsgD family transcriptional regulator
MRWAWRRSRSGPGASCGPPGRPPVRAPARPPAPAGTSAALTAQEAQVARLARDGLSNPEIGAPLFVSPGTAKYHLSNVFAKLGISSRSQLDRVLPADPDTAGSR